MASGSTAAPSLFLRNATGLVKGWSGFDAFTYSFMSVNLVTLGMFYSLAVFAYVPERTPSSSIVLAAIAVTFLAVAYAGLIAAMPRAGGDYVWQSRVLDGIPGIVTGAVVGAVAAYLVAQALGFGQHARPRHRSPRAARSAAPSAGSRAGSGSSSRRRAGGSSSPCGRRSTARSSRSSSSSRSPHSLVSRTA